MGLLLSYIVFEHIVIRNIALVMSVFIFKN